MQNSFERTGINTFPNDIEDAYSKIEFSNVLRDVAQVEAVTDNEASSPRLVAVNETDDSLTWMLGRLDHTVAAEKYQVLSF